MAINDKRPPKLGKYFNTHQVTPDELRRYEQQNLSQDLRILVFLKMHRNKWFDKHQIGKACWGPAYPVPPDRISLPPKRYISPSTVARAINTLMKKGLVVKSVATYYNPDTDRKIHQFKLNTNPKPQQSELF